MGSYVSSEDLLPAADVVVSGHSTVNYHAILWSGPCSLPCPSMPVLPMTTPGGLRDAVVELL